MLHAGKLLCHLHDIFAVHLTPYGADGSQIVFYIVDARDADLLHRQHRGRPAAVVAVQHPVLTQISAQRRDSFAAEKDSGPPHQRQEGGGDGIICIEYRAADATLMQQDVLFGIDVFLHILVDIQMVRCDVGDHSHIG